MNCEKCGRPLPEDSLFCPNCGHLNKRSSGAESDSVETPISERAPTKDFGTGFFKVVMAFVFVAFLFWTGYTFLYAPAHRAEKAPPRKQMAQSQQSYTPQQAILLALYEEFPQAEPRLEFLQGSNLDVYLKRQDFERIPFPDRPDVVTRLGKAWCNSVEQFFLPVLKIRDIKTGEVMAKYSCTTGNSSVE